MRRVAKKSFKIPKRYIDEFRQKLNIPQEISGSIDIDINSDIEKISYKISKNTSSAISLPIELDNEIMFHTHPFNGIIPMPPSGKDVLNLFTSSLKHLYNIEKMYKTENYLYNVNRVSLVITYEGIYLLPYLDLNNKFIKSFYNSYKTLADIHENYNIVNKELEDKYKNQIDEFNSLIKRLEKKQGNRHKIIFSKFHKSELNDYNIINEFIKNKDNKKLYTLSKNLYNKKLKIEKKLGITRDEALINKLNIEYDNFTNLIESTYNIHLVEFFKNYNLVMNEFNSIRDIIRVILSKKQLQDNKYRDIIAKLNQDIEIPLNKNVDKMMESQIKLNHQIIRRINKKLDTKFKFYPWNKKVKFLLNLYEPIEKKIDIYT